MRRLIDYLLGRRTTAVPTPRRDPLEVLADALARNAVEFRRLGQNCCAQGQEQMLIRLREAMAATKPA